MPALMIAETALTQAVGNMKDATPATHRWVNARLKLAAIMAPENLLPVVKSGKPLQFTTETHQ